jgi:hypothetical protein
MRTARPRLTTRIARDIVRLLHTIWERTTRSWPKRGSTAAVLCLMAQADHGHAIGSDRASRVTRR